MIYIHKINNFFTLKKSCLYFLKIIINLNKYKKLINFKMNSIKI